MLINQTTRDAHNLEHVHSDLVDDVFLIQSLHDGCNKCFEALFARYWKLVYAIAWKILRQRTDAEDIVQEVFLTIYLQRDRYDSTRGSVKTWIAQFAHFKALIRRRYLQTREERDLDELSEFESGLQRFGTSQDLIERATFVDECLRTLNSRQRRTIELVHFDGYTLMETATVLKQSLANTRNLYYRGMKSMRLQLQAPHKLAAMNETNAAGDEAAGEPLISGMDL